MNENNIYPIFGKMLERRHKETLLSQHGLMVWLTGLSGSGKSTIAIALERRLHNEGVMCCILDGDNIRSGINSDLGFSTADRIENIRRIAEWSRLFVNNAFVCIAAFITPTESLRQMAAGVVGTDSFVDVYVSTPIEVCEKRDVKGLYAKARRGEIKDFTGVSSPFEQPANPDITIDTSAMTVEQAVEAIMDNIKSRIR